MAKIKRKQLVGLMKFVNSRLEYFKLDRCIGYYTKDKHVPGVGYIQEIENFEELLKFKRKINELADVANADFSKEIEQLGLSLNEIPQKTEPKILGFDVEYWDNDIQTKLLDLRHNIKHKQLLTAKKLISKHLTVDDEFDIDMLEIEPWMVHESSETKKS